MTRNKTEHARRQFIKSVVVLGLSESCLNNSAHGNPLMWILRTGLVHSAVLLAKGALKPPANRPTTNAQSGSAEIDSQDFTDQARLQTAPFSQDPLTENLMHLKHSEHGTGIEIWDSSVSRSLYLQIPPVSQIVSDRLVVSMHSLDTGHTSVIADSPLTIMPSKDFAYPEIPLRPFNLQGLYRFDATVLAMNHDISIRSTPPVLMQ